MQRAVKKSTALAATAAMVGFSALFMASPANAAPASCSNGATLLPGNICELKLTTVGPNTFTPSAEMSQLEVLLVAGGGNGATFQGYGAGGGGEVKVVGFDSDPVAPLTLIVGDANMSSSATQGTTTATARAGNAGSFGLVGGTSGTLKPAFPGGSSGGGAGAIPVDAYTGGAGVSVASIAPAGSLFATDTTCYGGGGASGTHGGLIGTATCGAGSVIDGPSEVILVAPSANTGGGGAAGGTGSASATGASGLVVLRWVPVDVTVSFVSNGHGASIAAQTFARGGQVTPPGDLIAAGFVFNGWFADAGLTTPADFTAPITTSTTFYASWTAVTPLPVTVGFDNNGHGDSVPSQTVASGGTVTPPAQLTATGFVFNGWFADAGLTTPADFTAPITAPTTFYASWTTVPPVTTVTITFSDGHGGVTTQTIPAGGKATKPADPTMVGFTFDGWFTDAALTVPADFSAPFSASTTLYASWTAVKTPVVTPEKPATAPATPQGVDKLASTGAGIDSATVPVGLAALGLGAGLLALRARRSRKTN